MSVPFAAGSVLYQTDFIRRLIILFIARMLRLKNVNLVMVEGLSGAIMCNSSHPPLQER